MKLCLALFIFFFIHLKIANCQPNNHDDIRCYIYINFNSQDLLTRSYSQNYELFNNKAYGSMLKMGNECVDDNIVIQYHKGSTQERSATITSSPGDNEDKSLLFKLAKPEQSKLANRYNNGRIQLNYYNLLGANHISLKFKLLLHTDFNHIRSYDKPFEWLTISEFWNNAGWTGEKYPFRISLNIVKGKNTEKQQLYLKVKAQTLDIEKRNWNYTVWSRTDDSYPVPIDKWLTFNIELLEGDSNSGIFILYISSDGNFSHKVFHINNFTHHPSDRFPDGFKHINPIKLYTSAPIIEHVSNLDGSLMIYWDNLEIRY